MAMETFPTEAAFQARIVELERDTRSNFVILKKDKLFGDGKCAFLGERNINVT